jgi:hypothetical protein
MQNLTQQITATDTFSSLILFSHLPNLHTAMLEDFRITFKLTFMIVISSIHIIKHTSLFHLIFKL